MAIYGDSVTTAEGVHESNGAKGEILLIMDD